MTTGKIPEYIDDEDILAILSIGTEKLSHTKIQKIAYILSNVTAFKGKFTPHEFGDFSESIMEKIQSPLNRNIFSVGRDSYSLTEKGREIYLILLSSLSKKEKEMIENSVPTLRKLNTESLEALTYHLFPEMAVNSTVGSRINSIITNLKSRGIIKAERKDDTITLSMG